MRFRDRFTHAAAFFLLAGNVWDAVETCLSKLDDIQLAMVIVRLYEGDIETVPDNLKKLLYQEVLGRKPDGTDYKPSTAHPDPFLRSMAYWTLQDYSNALSTLLDTDIGCDHFRSPANDVTKDEGVHPSIFNFYLYLRTHPLIVKRHLAQIAQDKKVKDAENLSSEAITPFERRLFFKTAHQHFRSGCPSLGLEVLSRLPSKILPEESMSILLTRRDTLSAPLETITGQLGQSSFDDATSDATMIKQDSIDWGAPVAVKQDHDDSGFDWGAPTVPLGGVDTSDLKIDIKIDSDNESGDDDGLVMAKQPEVSEISIEGRDLKVDIMAQQLKFIACLKIIMEEMSTLTIGFGSDEQLRYYFYVWLEQTVAALKTICSCRTFSMRDNKYARQMQRQPSTLIAEELVGDDSKLDDRCKQLLKCFVTSDINCC